jgi:hypothetical protein
MQTQDILVGAMTAALGLVIILGAAGGRTWLLERRGARSLVEAFGQPAARIVLVLIGFALIILGALLALGWRLNWL